MTSHRTTKNFSQRAMKSSRALTLLIGLVFVCCAAANVQAQSTAFMYQGRLTDAGAPANGVYDLEFKLYDAGGAPIGNTTREDVQVTDGTFTVQLDFGQPPFVSGAANTLEIGVRPGTSTGAFTAMSPRQPLTSSPYAIQTINAAQLGGVPANQYVKTDDPRLSTSGGSGNYIQNTTTQQPNASFNISGNGIVAGNVGIGTNALTRKLQVIGSANQPAIYGESNNRGVWGVSTGNSYGVYGESINGIGMQGVSTNNVGTTGASTNHVGVYGSTAAKTTTSPGVLGVSTGFGGVGVRGDGTTGVLGNSTSAGGVGVTGTGQTGVAGISTNGSGVSGNSTNASGIYGESTNGAGVTARSQAGSGLSGYSATGIGVQASAGSGYAIYADGNAGQALDKGGFAKALIRVDSTGTITACYNSQLPDGGASVAGCRFKVKVRNTETAPYVVTFPFKVRERFVVVTMTELIQYGHTAASILPGGDYDISVYTYVSGQPIATTFDSFTLVVF